MFEKDLELSAMPTPNPNTIKFILNYDFFRRGSLDFPTSEKGMTSPLIQKLFTVDGLKGVLVGANFVSITKADDAGWESVLEKGTEIIQDVLTHVETPIDLDLIKELEAVGPEQDAVVTKIKQILDDEIRPAIAMDGGDCQFHSYEDGVLTLQLQGACSSCPSSVMTLKLGIENRLKQDIPELKDVVQI